MQAEQLRREEYNKKVADANEKQERTETKEVEAAVTEKEESAGTEKTNLPSEEPSTDEN